MQVEWEGSLRVVAQRQGLAEFEHWLAEKGEEQGISVEWSQLQVMRECEGSGGAEQQPQRWLFQSLPASMTCHVKGTPAFRPQKL